MCGMHALPPHNLVRIAHPNYTDCAMHLLIYDKTGADFTLEEVL